MCKDLYREHLQRKLDATRAAMSAAGYRELIIFSGSTHYRFRDDLPLPFRANAHFREWLDCNEPRCFIRVSDTTDRPELLRWTTEDYWHSVPAPLAEDQVACFNVTRLDQWPPSPELLKGDGKALLGDLGESGLAAPSSLAVNPASLLPLLDESRTRKSAWEIYNIREANQIAVAGHLAAAEEFRRGGSELDIHLSYLRAAGTMESELPYDNIVGLNGNAAVLHHWRLGNRRPQTPRSLLIDAGAVYRGYAADVTRTHAFTPGLFADLIAEMDALQRDIAARVAPGVSFAALHDTAREAIGRLLRSIDLAAVDEQEPDHDDIVGCFFPHGLGHFLGIQVHDKGGHDATGGTTGEHTNLRLSRSLAPQNVLTIEPGLYLIPSLLERLRQTKSAARVNWKMVEALAPYGGIRIEDNLVVTQDGAVNLTREAFADAGGLFIINGGHRGSLN